MIPAILFVLLAHLPLPQAPAATDVTRLALSPAKAITEIDTGKLKGEPTRLSWESDTSRLYLRTTEVDRWLNERTHHYLISMSAPTAVEVEPGWASAYWAWKSERFSPADPAFKVEIESTTKRLSSTSTVRGGDIAGMGGDPSMGTGGGSMPAQTAVDAAMQSQQATTLTGRVKGQIVGEWTNQQPQPGKQMGWAPTPMTALAYVDPRKHLMLVDRDGRTREVPGAVDVMLPAWSTNGKQLAYLQKKDKKKYTLMVMDVGQQ